VQFAQTVAIDTKSQRIVFRKYFQFRGDNDEAWQRAERFVSEEAATGCLKADRSNRLRATHVHGTVSMAP
jgi:hypothetical protein